MSTQEDSYMLVFTKKEKRDIKKSLYCARVLKSPFQAKMAPTRATMSPAEPKLTALVRAPFALPLAVLGVEEGEDVLDGRTEDGLEEVRGFVVVVEVEGVEVVDGIEVDVEFKEPLLLRSEELGGILMELEAEQVLVPGCTVKGADWEVAPVWSRSNSPRLVPAGSVTSQVNEVPVRLDQEKREGEEGLVPETTLKKKGPALP